MPAEATDEILLTADPEILEKCIHDRNMAKLQRARNIKFDQCVNLATEVSNGEGCRTKQIALLEAHIAQMAQLIYELKRQREILFASDYAGSSFIDHMWGGYNLDTAQYKSEWIIKTASKLLLMIIKKVYKNKRLDRRPRQHVTFVFKREVNE